MKVILTADVAKLGKKYDFYNILTLAIALQSEFNLDMGF